MMVVIVILAAVVRLLFLGSNPPGIIPDEAEFGYTAYSILKTGTTPYGTLNPLAFREFPNGLFPPLYSYVLIPFIHIFGLSIFIERLPSALFGIASCVLMYVLIKQLFRQEKAAQFGAFLMAINPWAVFYSREGRFEMIGLFLVLSGATLFIRGLTQMANRYYLPLSAVAFGLSLHANDATKLVVPFLILVLLWYGGKRLLGDRRNLVFFLAVFSIFFALELKVLFMDGQIGDYSRSSNFAMADIERQVNLERGQTLAPLWLSSVFHNKFTVLFHRFASELMNNFSLSWLFIDGNGHLQESLGRHGQYYLFELPLFIIGLFAVRKNRKAALLLLFWAVLANIPGAITKGHFYPYRSILLLPVPIVVSAVGFERLWGWSSRMRGRLTNAVRGIAALLSLGLVISFFFTLFFDAPVYTSEWRYKERTDALRFAHANEDRYEQIFVAGRFELTHAFMKSIDPRDFQRQFLSYETYREVPVMRLGKYTFGTFPIGSIATPSAYFPKDSLVIADADSVNAQIVPVKTFTGSDPLRGVYTAYEVNGE